MQKKQKKETKLVTRIDRGKRVREERNRLQFTQKEIADICGVHRVQWGRYERGEQGLDGEPLERFADVGASVGYILTGQRASASATLIGQVQVTQPIYSEDETNLVASFRKLSDTQRDAVLAMMEAFTS